MMRFYTVKDGTLGSSPVPPDSMFVLSARPNNLLPPMISTLHERFAEWGRAGYSPGPMIPERIWLDGTGNLAFACDGMPPGQLAPGRDLAAWLVLLDKWMETFVVIARARAVWSVAELAGALRFLSPGYLPSEVMALPPDNWAQVAAALATAVADGPLQGAPQNRHWQEKV